MVVESFGHYVYFRITNKRKASFEMANLSRKTRCSALRWRSNRKCSHIARTHRFRGVLATSLAGLPDRRRSGGPDPDRPGERFQCGQSQM